MIINTIEELKQRIGKFVVLSHFNPNFDDNTISMKLLTKVEDGWLRHCDAVMRECQLSNIFGYKICGKLSAQMNPFIPFVTEEDGTTHSNSYMYARDATEEEIKEFMQHWRLAIYKNKIKPKQKYEFKYPHREDYELPF